MPRKQGHGSSAKRSRNQNNQRMSAQRQSQSGQAENVDEEMPASASAPASALIAARRGLFSAADEDVRAAGADDLRHALFSGECGLPILTLPAFYDCSPIHPLLLSALRAYSYSPCLLLHQSIHSFFLPSANMAGSPARADRRGGRGRGYARIINIIYIIIVIVIGISIRSTGLSLRLHDRSSSACCSTSSAFSTT